MAHKFDVTLNDEQKAAMAAIPETSWFTQVLYQNAASPIHPNRALVDNNNMKQTLTSDWIARSVKGKRVLDLFSANGGFAFLAATAGAKQVTGLEYSAERIKCAEFVASTIQTDCRFEFKQGDVYKLREYFDAPFDVVLCLGGLYHIADPAYVLTQIRDLTNEHMILQTSQVLPYLGNRAKFVVRRTDKRKGGMTSIRGGYGTWHYSPACLRELILHARFNIQEERRPPWFKRGHYPWYLAYCEPF
jgi:2-polyprenyl-3-methyl-5-hydroxy-6-metoxy-1,4-benzoquinol methylase